MTPATSTTTTTTIPPKKKRHVLRVALLTLLVAIIAFLIVVALQPAQYRVSRTLTMNAAPAATFAQVNDFHNWEAWNPWGKIDPAMKVTYDGPTSGVGASYAWVGNSDVGEGKMTITESMPDERVGIKLEFFKPMAAVSQSDFTFKPVDGSGTAVTWTMIGENNFVGKAMCLFMDMDKMIGGQFEKGLADMKTVVEGPVAATTTAPPATAE